MSAQAFTGPQWVAQGQAVTQDSFEGWSIEITEEEGREMKSQTIVDRRTHRSEVRPHTAHEQIMKPAGAEPRSLPTDQRLTLTIPEACQALGIGETMLRQMIREKQLPILRLGRRVLVPRQAVEALVAGVCEESQSAKDLDSTKR